MISDDDDDNKNPPTTNVSHTNEGGNEHTPLATTSSLSSSTTILLCNASASALASIISRLCTHPFDTIKARIQILHTNNANNNSSSSSSSSSTSFHHSPHTSNRFLHPIKIIIGESGNYGNYCYNTMKTLYRGLGVVIIGGTPGTMLYLCTYDIAKQQLSNLSLSRPPAEYNNNDRNRHTGSNPINTNYNFLIHFMSGMIAETIACIVYVPVDVIKERMQVQQQQVQSQPPSPTTTTTTSTIHNTHINSIPTNHNHSNYNTVYYRNTYDAVRQIIHTEGIRGIYRGYAATLASFGPFSALYFVFYESFKNTIYTSYHHPTATTTSSSHYVEIPFHWTVICAATAGGVASFLTSPLDMAKLRLQVQRGNRHPMTSRSSTTISLVHNIPPPVPPPPTTTSTTTPLIVEYTGMMDVLQKVYRQYGIRGLFRGAGARVLHFAPATTVTMTTYETLRQQFEAYLVPHQ